MNVNLEKIDGFYKTALGIYSKNQISESLKKILPIRYRACVASAASGFYADNLESCYTLITYQSYEYQSFLPTVSKGKFVTVENIRWPHQAEEIDVIVMIHDIEFSKNPEIQLHEAWRVLNGEGKLIILFPNRQGQWVREDTTPFGNGFPYSLTQMRKLLNKTHFVIEKIHPALFFPAFEPKNKIMQWLRQTIDRCHGFFIFKPGIYIIEVTKHVPAPIGGGLKEIAQIAKKALQPNPSPTAARLHKDL